MYSKSFQIASLLLYLHSETRSPPLSLLTTLREQVSSSISIQRTGLLSSVSFQIASLLFYLFSDGKSPPLSPLIEKVSSSFFVLRAGLLFYLYSESKSPLLSLLR